MTRLLLIADDAFDDDRALPACAGSLREADHVDVLAPIIASRLDVIAEDEAAYRDAEARADRVVAELAADGISATGRRSSEDPFDTAVAALAAEDYAGVVVATTGDGHWREEGLLERLREAVEVPVTAIAVGD